MSLCFCCCIVLQLVAQTASLDRKVSWDYQDVRLEEALADISRSYNVKFSYSNYYIPIDQRVTTRVVNEPLNRALTDLFDETDIIFKSIGDQYVLRPDYNSKTKSISYQSKPSEGEMASKNNKNIILPAVTNSKIESTQINNKDKEEFIYQVSEIKEEKTAKDLPYRDIARAKIPQALMPIETMPLTPLEFAMAQKKERKQIQIDLSKYKAFIEKIEAQIKEKLQKKETEKIKTESKKNERLAQVSVLPFVGTNAVKSNKVKNNVSVNVFWGMNGGVEGVEVGGIMNSIKNDVKGGQFAGFGNTVGGNVDGVQISGFFNYVNGTNNGFQGAVVTNISRKGGNNTQLAGFTNVTGGDADIQASGLANFAKGNVKIAQLSGFINKATYVKGVQIGLINVCDSIGGAPIGLINIVKSGKNKYNKVELASSETFNGIGELKFGSKHLYNILHFGYLWNDQNTNENSWALGFGIGTAIDFRKRSLINVELLAMHVSERAAFTTQLNLLSQLKLTYDFRLFRNVNIFLGPTLNVSVSDAYDQDTGFHGTQLAPSNLLFKNRLRTFTTSGGMVFHNTSVKAWIGFTGGVRF